MGADAALTGLYLESTVGQVCLADLGPDGSEAPAQAVLHAAHPNSHPQHLNKFAAKPIPVFMPGRAGTRRAWLKATRSIGVLDDGPSAVRRWSLRLDPKHPAIFPEPAISQPGPAHLLAQRPTALLAQPPRSLVAHRWSTEPPSKADADR